MCEGMKSNSVRLTSNMLDIRDEFAQMVHWKRVFEQIW